MQITISPSNNAATGMASVSPVPLDKYQVPGSTTLWLTLYMRG